jgi:hypothetical protein
MQIHWKGGGEEKADIKDADWFCFMLHSGSLSSIVSQNKEQDLGQKYLGKTLNSSRSQQKKKVRWTPNTVEPSGDNQDYRRRPRSTIHSVCPHSPIQRPLTSYACERPRLQSQAAKNTITGTQQTVLKNQYNYMWWQKNPIRDLRSWCVFLGCLFCMKECQRCALFVLVMAVTHLILPWRNRVTGDQTRNGEIHDCSSTAIHQLFL